MKRDLRFAIRMLLKQPGFSLIAVLVAARRHLDVRMATNGFNRSNQLVPRRLSYNLGTIAGGDTIDPRLSSVWSAPQA